MLVIVVYIYVLGMEVKVEREREEEQEGEREAEQAGIKYNIIGGSLPCVSGLHNPPPIAQHHTAAINT